MKKLPKLLAALTISVSAQACLEFDELTDDVQQALATATEQLNFQPTSIGLHVDNTWDMGTIETDDATEEGIESEFNALAGPPRPTTHTGLPARTGSVELERAIINIREIGFARVPTKGTRPNNERPEGLERPAEGERPDNGDGSFRPQAGERPVSRPADGERKLPEFDNVLEGPLAIDLLVREALQLEDIALDDDARYAAFLFPVSDDTDTPSLDVDGVYANEETSFAFRLQLQAKRPHIMPLHRLESPRQATSEILLARALSRFPLEECIDDANVADGRYLITNDSACDVDRFLRKVRERRDDIRKRNRQEKREGNKPDVTYVCDGSDDFCAAARAKELARDEICVESVEKTDDSVTISISDDIENCESEIELPRPQQPEPPRQD